MRLSVVVPTLDEAAELPGFLEHLERDLPHDAEILVADGGSRDGTLSLVGGRARLVAAPRGRARQMNAGAGAAAGDVLLFLHADTRLGEGAAGSVARALDDPRVAGGLFAKEPFRSPRILRLADAALGFLQRRRPTLLGDRGIFVRRAVFEEVGGFRDLAIMEDPDLGWRLERVGRLVEIGPAVRTSDRRFRQGGPLRTLLLMLAIFTLFRLGVSDRWLARLYAKVR